MDTAEIRSLMQRTKARFSQKQSVRTKKRKPERKKAEILPKTTGILGKKPEGKRNNKEMTSSEIEAFLSWKEMPRQWWQSFITIHYVSTNTNNKSGNRLESERERERWREGDWDPEEGTAERKEEGGKEKKGCSHIITALPGENYVQGFTHLLKKYLWANSAS